MGEILSKVDGAFMSENQRNQLDFLGEKFDRISFSAWEVVRIIFVVCLFYIVGFMSL